MRPTARTTSRRCGAAGTCCASRRTTRRASRRDEFTKSHHLSPLDSDNSQPRLPRRGFFRGGAGNSWSTSTLRPQSTIAALWVALRLPARARMARGALVVECAPKSFHAPVNGFPLDPHIVRARRRHTGYRLWHLLLGRLRRDRRKRAQARLSSHRHRLEVRHRARRRRRHPRLGPAAQRDFPHHQGIARIPARRRLCALGRAEPEDSRRRLRRSPARALAEPGDWAERGHSRGGRGQTARTCARYRGCEFQYRHARRSDPALSGAAGQPAGRVSRPSRPDQAHRRVPPARSDLHRLLPARPRAAVARPGARRHCRPQRPHSRSNRAALADPAGQHRSHSAFVERHAHGREPQRLRLCTDRRGDGADRGAEAARRQDRQSRRPCAGVGLRWRKRTMTKTPKYFMYFPGNYRWSAAFVNMLGRASYGGADISELHKIGRALAGKAAEDDAAWFDACVNVADEVRGHPERFAASGHAVSAAAFYLRACHYYQMGERFRTPKDKAALDAYRTAVDCFHRFAALTDVKIDIVEVPFEGKSLPGYFVHAQNAKS